MILNRALWHIETQLGSEDLSLRSVASAVGVSPEYLTRAFTTLTGRPLMAYMRARRLSVAAQGLAAGKGSVISLALEAGYGSPEAFARAFRARYGLPPSAVKRLGLAGLSLTPALEFAMTSTPMFPKPEVESMPERRLRGLMRRYTMETRAAIPGQWADYNATVPEPVPLPSGWFGICRGVGDQGDFDYLCGVDQVEGGEGPDAITLPAGRYARFATNAHISTMQAAWAEIVGYWMGQPGLSPASGPQAEFYPPAFDGQTGEGGYEIWIPLE